MGNCCGKPKKSSKYREEDSDEIGNNNLGYQDEVESKETKRNSAVNGKTESKRSSKAESQRNSKAESKRNSKAESHRNSKADSKRNSKADSKRNSKAENQRNSKAESQRNSQSENKRSGSNRNSKQESNRASKSGSQRESEDENDEVEGHRQSQLSETDQNQNDELINERHSQRISTGAGSSLQHTGRHSAAFQRGSSNEEEDMSVDPMFKAIPKGCTCFLIWRVEDFNLKPLPKDQYGNFYEGDSYIIYAATERNGEIDPSGEEVKEVRGSLDIRIHFWLGHNTTQDESGTAAIKAVELDDYLGGTPIQYREVQGRESKVFLNYFRSKGGVKYVTGGHASGFSHVDNTIKTRLLHVKGKHSPRIQEIPIEWGAMNCGDAYILDVGEAFFVWQGGECSRTEKLKSMEYARRLRDDRGKGNLIVVEDGEESIAEMGATEYALFSEWLPKDKKGDLKSASEGGADDAYERKSAANIKLFKCREEDGKLTVSEIAAKPLKREMLDTDDTFIVDNGAVGIWVWCGRKATKNEKRAGMSNANSFISKKGYPTETPVVKVHEGGEPTEFKALFKVWEAPKLPGEIDAYNPNRIAPRMLQTKFDASTLHDNPTMARDTGMVDDGTGAKKIWRVERQGTMYDIEELEQKYYGMLYGGDSYIIQYTYGAGGRQNNILYYWLGKKSTQDEKGVAARKTVELDDAMGGLAKQVRVVHGKEPSHFLSMFDGKLIIFDGGKAGWGQDSDEGPGDIYLLHVRGTSSINTKAEQVPLRAESLNSNDVFVLFSPSAIYVWAGKGSTGDEREMAKQIASTSPRGYKLVMEEQESNDFWDLLGGKTEYSSSPRLAESSGFHPPRLFQCSNASGMFSVSEIVEFTQQDLVPDDVFILDTYDNIFVWIGDEARPEEKSQAMDTAVDYIETDPSGRDSGTPIFRVKQGYEPPDFVGYFGVWDRDMWSAGKSYEELKRELGEKNVQMTEVEKKTEVNGPETSFSEVGKYPLDQLTDRENIPEGVDIANRERYLSDSDFHAVFGMDYDTFSSQPKWKQERKKKEVGLW